MNKKFTTAIFFVLLIAGCRSKDNQKMISIFTQPSYDQKAPKNHIEIYLNKVKVTEKDIEFSQIPASIFVECILIDSTKENNITIKINNKSANIDPTKYHAKCLDIFTSYDRQEKLRNEFHDAEKESVLKTGRTLVYKKFLDSVRLVKPIDKYDTILYGVQLNKCWCDSVNRK